MRKRLALATIALVIIALTLFYRSKRPRNGDHSHPPKFFHDDYTGEAFSYPATWEEDKGEFAFAGYKGDRNCGFSVYRGNFTPGKGAESMDILRKTLVAANPQTSFGPRPAWAGPEQPVGSLAASFTHKGKQFVEYRSFFEAKGNQETVYEYMQANDEACRSDLQMIESTFHVLTPTGRSSRSNQ